MSVLERQSQRWKLSTRDILVMVSGICISMGIWRLSATLQVHDIACSITVWNGGLFIFAGTIGALFWRLANGIEIGLARGFVLGGALGIFLVAMVSVLVRGQVYF